MSFAYQSGDAKSFPFPQSIIVIPVNISCYSPWCRFALYLLQLIVPPVYFNSLAPILEFYSIISNITLLIVPLCLCISSKIHFSKLGNRMFFLILKNHFWTIQIILFPLIQSFFHNELSNSLLGLREILKTKRVWTASCLKKC